MLFSQNAIAQQRVERAVGHLSPAVRYSEDLDFVQGNAEVIGEVLSAIKKICRPLFGKPRTRQKEDSVILTFHSVSELPPSIPLRIKVEVNTREHIAVFPIEHKAYEIDCQLIAAKHRALNLT